MKKFFSWIIFSIAACLLFGIFTGCTTQEETPSLSFENNSAVNNGDKENNNNPPDEIVTDNNNDNKEEITEKIEDISELSDIALDTLIMSLKERWEYVDEAINYDSYLESYNKSKDGLQYRYNELVNATAVYDNAVKNNSSIPYINSCKQKLDQCQASYDAQNAAFLQRTEYLNQSICGNAWKNVVDELNSGDATNDSILSILEKWEKCYVGDTAPIWKEVIIRTIKINTEIDLSE